MTKSEWVNRWKKHVAGMALFGLASEHKDGPISRAVKILEIPGEVEGMLNRMYDELIPPPKPEVKK